MKLQLKLFLTYFIICLVDDALTNSDIPEHFCGKHLSNFLSSRCKLYNSPSNGRIRSRRAVVEECCRKPCSQRYLLCNYCAKSDVVCATHHAFKTTTSTSITQNGGMDRIIPENAKHYSETGSTLLSTTDQQENIFLCHRRFQRVVFTLHRTN